MMESCPSVPWLAALGLSRHPVEVENGDAACCLIDRTNIPASQRAQIGDGAITFLLPICFLILSGFVLSLRWAMNSWA
jgi:hypothetical protein